MGTTVRTKLTDEDIDRVREAAQALVAEHHLPGLAVGVVRGDELAYAEGFGFADIESQRPQDPSLRQRIGSITKTMTALCVMALVDEGKLSLEDRVVDLLPDMTFHGPASEVRLRHLLTHTSGIGEAPTLAELPQFEAFLYTPERNVSRVPDAYPNGIEIEVPPGTKWAYANHGYALLGEIVMRKEDAAIDEVMARRIFAPLGMKNTDARDEPHPDLTTGYHRAPSPEEVAFRRRLGLEVLEETPVDGLNIRGEPYLYIAGLSRRAAGAVQSTIPDMARYASALLRKSKGIVRPETFDAMTAPQWCPDARLSSMGLAFFRGRAFGRRTLLHSGGVGGGWNTLLDVYPDDDLAVLTHLNLAFIGLDEVASRLARAALGASDEPLPAARPIDARVLAAAPGVFEGSVPGPLTNFRIAIAMGRVQITAEGDELMLRARRGPWMDGARMRPADASDPAFFTLERDGKPAGNVALVRDDAGRVTGMRFDGLVELVRNDEIEPWA